MVDGDFLELAWKDGQLVMRGRSLSPSCISYSSHRSPASHQVKKEEMYPMHPAKRPNFKQAYSISDGNPLLDLPGALDKLGSAPTSGIPSGGNPHPLKTCRTYQLDEPNSKDQFQGSMGGLANSNLKQVGSSGPEKHFGFGNFSLFLRPAVLFKAYGQNNGATRPSNGRSSLRLEEMRSNSNEKSAPVIGSSNHHVESSLMEPASSLEGPQDYLPGQPMATKTEPIAKPVEEPPPPDEQSENFVNRNDIASKRPSDQYFGLNSCSQADKIKGTPDMGKGIDNQLAGTTSICSRGASNDVTCSLRSRYEGIADASENVEGEQRGVKKLGGNKRKRTAEGHSLSEKKRREKINKRLRALQDLVPNSNKADKASMLDEAIEYIKTLQLQLQMMSVGSGLYNHMPPMMLTNGLRHLQAPQLAAPLHPVAAGFGVSIPMSTAPMVGLPGQMMMPMSTLSVAQSLPFIGGLQRQIPVPVPAGICSLDLLGSAPLLIGSKDNGNNAEKINPKKLNTLDSRIQASNQAIRGSSKH